MRTIKRLLLFALPALLLAGCNNEDFNEEPGGQTGTNGDITFEIGFTPQTRVSTGADFKSAWETGDEIGVFAVRRASTGTGSLSATASANYINNVKLTYNGTSWTAATALYYPAGTDVLDFYAYYPYDASANDPTAIAFNVKTDQSGTTNINSTDRSNYSLSDLLTAKSNNSGNGYGRTTASVPLIFNHALAMVQVSVPSGGKGFGPGENLKVMLRGVRPGAALNLGNISGTAGSEITVPSTGNDATNITMYRVEQPADADYETSYTYRALVPAQDVEQGSSLFWFEHEGRQLLQDGALGSTFSMIAGQAETFTRTLPALVQTVNISAAGQTFTMGETGWATPVHDVTFTKDFRMSTYQVTKSQFAEFLNAVGVAEASANAYASHDVSGYGTQRIFMVNEWGWTPAWNSTENRWEASGDTPMINVTWYGAKAYADWVGGSLPTEAQWEYACRAGTATAFYFGNDETALGDYGWYRENSSTIQGPSPVGGKIPNDYGLYDMHGNVWEWCSDWYATYDGNPATDPTGAASGSDRVLRGGSWLYDAQDCRSAYRFNSYPFSANINFGFRVVFPAP